MNPPPPLVDAAGRPFPLGPKLAAGGEGTVYTLPGDPDRVAKVYHGPPSPQTAAKLAAMVSLANAKLAEVAAWPEALLFAVGGRGVAGFLMPRLVDCQPLQHLYNPVQRLRYFPRCGWDFQLRAALNCAAAFDEVHRAGCLVGDVNQSNVQVTPQALVRVIDCDSFQVRAGGQQFLCEVGVPHYTPPELQGKSLRGLVRTENHDRFGLAVLVFQLLLVGRHPYAGIYLGPGDPSFEELIAQYRFAHGPDARRWDMQAPPHTPTAADLPPDLFRLFRRAFERGSENGTRPAPAEWLPVLKDLEQNLAECAADPGHKYWRGLAACPWCRLAAHGGPEYYFGVAGGAAAFAVDEAKWQEVQRRLAAARLEDFPFDPSRFAPATPPAPEALPANVRDGVAFIQVLTGATLLGLLAMPLGLWQGFFFGCGLLVTLVFGVWTAVMVARSPLTREFRRRRAALTRAEGLLHGLGADWAAAVHRYRERHQALTSAVARQVAECRGLAARYATELHQRTGNAEALARLRHLRLHLIADATIPKIGAARKQALAAANVLTAEDVDPVRIQAIKGFGAALTGNLVAWREEVLRAFRFDRTAALAPAEQRAVAAEFRNRQRQLLTAVTPQVTELEGLAGQCRSQLAGLTKDLRRAVQAWVKAEADFRLLRGR